MSRPPTRQHAEPEVIWSMPCAEMLKEVVRLMNAHNPRALLGLTPIEQEDVNRYMQVAWDHRRKAELLPAELEEHKWPPTERMLERWPRTHRTRWIGEVVHIEYMREAAIRRGDQHGTDILYDPLPGAPPFVKRSGRKHPGTHRYTVADCLEGFHHFHDAPEGFAEQEGGGFMVHPSAHPSSTRSSPVSSPVTASPPQLTGRVSGYWGDMPANISEVRQARIERPASSHSAHYPLQPEERPSSSARHAEHHPHEAYPAPLSRYGSHDPNQGSAWERIGRRQNRVEEEDRLRSSSRTTHQQLYHTNTLPVPPSHALHHSHSPQDMPYRAYTDPTQHATQHHQQEGPLPPHPAHVPQRRRTRLHKRVLRKASGWLGGSQS